MDIEIPVMPDPVDCAFYIEKLLNVEKRKEVISKLKDQIAKHNIEFDYIACRGVSGLIIASMLGYEMDMPICIVRKDLEMQTSHSRRNIEFPNHLSIYKNYKYIVVDDLIDSGSTIREILTKINHYRRLHDSCAAILLHSPLNNHEICIDGNDRILMQDISIYSLNGRMNIRFSPNSFN